MKAEISASVSKFVCTNLTAKLSDVNLLNYSVVTYLLL